MHLFLPFTLIAEAAADGLFPARLKPIAAAGRLTHSKETEAIGGDPDQEPAMSDGPMEYSNDVGNPAIGKYRDTLQRIEKLGESTPSELNACTTCPVSLWLLRGEKHLTCFCSALHRDTWDSDWSSERQRDDTVYLCDGREQALAEFAIARAASTR